MHSALKRNGQPLYRLGAPRHRSRTPARAIRGGASACGTIAWDGNEPAVGVECGKGPVRAYAGRGTSAPPWVAVRTWGALRPHPRRGCLTSATRSGWRSSSGCRSGSGASGLPADRCVCCRPCPRVDLDPARACEQLEQGRPIACGATPGATGARVLRFPQGRPARCGHGGPRQVDWPARLFESGAGAGVGTMKRQVHYRKHRDHRARRSWQDPRWSTSCWGSRARSGKNQKHRRTGDGQQRPGTRARHHDPGEETGAVVYEGTHINIVDNARPRRTSAARSSACCRWSTACCCWSMRSKDRCRRPGSSRARRWRWA